jgi:hypothetical protein
MPGVDHFDGHANLTQGQRRGGAPILSELMGVSGRSRYVDLNTTVSPAHRDGSRGAPYSDIQSAIDKQEEDASILVGPSPIYISPGWYRERLVIHKAGLCLIGGSGGQRQVSVTPESGLPAALTLTNATPESLAAFESSGDYADLVNQGDGGPYDFFASGINFYNWGVNNPALPGVSLWGVKGDAGGGDETWFMSGNDGVSFGTLFTITPTFFGCHMWGLRGRNVGGMFLDTSEAGEIDLRNFKNVQIKRTFFNSHDPNVFEYDAASPYGQPASGHQQMTFGDCDIAGSLSVLGSANWAQSVNYPSAHNRITEAAVFDTTGVIFLTDWTFEDDVTFADGVVATMKNCFIGGDLICAAGSGAITMLGGRYMGSLTDPNARLTHTQGNIGT